MIDILRFLFTPPKTLLPRDDSEADKLKFQVLLEEFRQMREEIRMQLVEYKKVINLVVISFGALAAIGTANGAAVPRSILFLASFFYSLLALYILRHMWAVICIGRYVSDQIVPRIHETLKRLGPDTSIDRDLMHWERLGPKANYSGGLLMPLEVVTVSIPLLPGIILLVLGWISAEPSNTLAVSPVLKAGLTYGLGVIATLAVAYVVGVALWMRGQLLIPKSA